MKSNWGIKIVVVFVFAFVFVLFAGASAMAQAPSTHKAEIKGTITLEPGVVSAAAGQAAPAYVLKKDEHGRWVYVRNEEGASALGVPDNSATALAEELNRARRRASTFAKHVKEATESVKTIGKALGEQDSRLDAHGGRLDGLDKAVADAKKLAQQALDATSRWWWGLVAAAIVLLILIICCWLMSQRLTEEEGMRSDGDNRLSSRLEALTQRVDMLEQRLPPA